MYCCFKESREFKRTPEINTFNTAGGQFSRISRITFIMLQQIQGLKFGEVSEKDNASNNQRHCEFHILL